jgi:hypothetical protein
MVTASAVPMRDFHPVNLVEELTRRRLSEKLGMLTSEHGCEHPLRAIALCTQSAGGVGRPAVPSGRAAAPG